MQTIRGVLGNAEVHVALSLVELKAIAYNFIGYRLYAYEWYSRRLVTSQYLRISFLFVQQLCRLFTS